MTYVPAFPKPLKKRNPDYLAYVRGQGCLICKNRAQAHHVGPRGVATKGSDYETVPLCWRHHQELHTKGRLTFERKHRLILRVKAWWLFKVWQDATGGESEIGED